MGAGLQEYALADCERLRLRRLRISRDRKLNDGYYRKDGTYVAPYDRSLPGSGDHIETHSTSTPTETHAASVATAPYRVTTATVPYDFEEPAQRDWHGRIKRSKPAIHSFRMTHPCPATDINTGSCPGYVIDHVRPLEFGGADAPLKMQWQTVAEGKAKDKTERYCR